MQTIFPNVVLIVRDAAHALRIAIKDPLHHDDVFGDVWDSLFNARHALVPDVMNIQKWQDLLQHIQADLLRIAGENQPLQDWGIVTQAFLRLFDKTSHDIAKTHAEIDAFKTVLMVVFRGR